MLYPDVADLDHALWRLAGKHRQRAGMPCLELHRLLNEVVDQVVLLLALAPQLEVGA